ncbi:hypothetical protein BDV26DRAFT_269684 [Aspergillus bertholletiae]|uniref:NAD-dependent epimerase/dehydratase domain-containing protein n=1 Tax=Aspergillus bertholletiae TaxID=1226010 RepID=A0A5N7B084_9EURO|nr:hypothetical protein BDV26DRAFT_269684 [Aspergillus bertholletiae]
MSICGDGHISRVFIWASDAAEALSVIFHQGAHDESFNISSNNHQQGRKLVDKIFQYFHLKYVVVRSLLRNGLGWYVRGVL